MERKPRRSKSQMIQDKISNVEEKITSLKEQILNLREQKKELEVELTVIIEQETKEREQKELQDLAVLIKAKNLSVDDIKVMIESQVAATEES